MRKAGSSIGREEASVSVPEQVSVYPHLTMLMPNDWATRVLLFLTTVTGNPASRLVSTRPIEQDLLASATLEKVSTWMAECLEGKAKAGWLSIRR
jgi:hypothetical protein